MDRQFDVAAPNRVWVSDITYIPTGEGWLYLATILDLYSRKIVGWSMDCSVSRQGDCWDNAVMESFYRRLKTELVHQQDYRTKEQARQDIFEYIEVFYNRQRIHSYLGYLCPADYEAQGRDA